MAIHDSYYKQNGCWNCKNLYFAKGVECGELYCDLSSTKPAITIGSLTECYDFYEWMEDHKVSTAGICDCYDCDESVPEEGLTNGED